MSGTINRLERATTVLETESGDEVRVANQLMLDSIVRVSAANHCDAG